MVKCPKCGKGIDFLECKQKDIVTYNFDGEDYIEEDREADAYSEPSYYCPECHSYLANNEAEAKGILGK